MLGPPEPSGSSVQFPHPGLPLAILSSSGTSRALGSVLRTRTGGGTFRLTVNIPFLIVTFFLSFSPISGEQVHNRAINLEPPLGCYRVECNIVKGKEKKSSEEVDATPLKLSGVCRGLPTYLPLVLPSPPDPHMTGKWHYVGASMDLFFLVFLVSLHPSWYPRPLLSLTLSTWRVRY